MGAFGLGTLPMMVGLGTYSAWLSRDRRSQLFQLGGWITLLIGILTLLRTGDLMVDYAGHLSLLCLALALIARPVSKIWPHLLRFSPLAGRRCICAGPGAHSAHARTQLELATCRRALYAAATPVGHGGGRDRAHAHGAADPYQHRYGSAKFRQSLAIAASAEYSGFTAGWFARDRRRFKLSRQFANSRSPADSFRIARWGHAAGVGHAIASLLATPKSQAVVYPCHQIAAACSTPDVTVSLTVLCVYFAALARY